MKAKEYRFLIHETGNPLPLSELLDRVSLIESYLDDGKNVQEISLITNIGDTQLKD